MKSIDMWLSHDHLSKKGTIPKSSKITLSMLFIPNVWIRAISREVVMEGRPGQNSMSLDFDETLPDSYTNQYRKCVKISKLNSRYFGSYGFSKLVGKAIFDFYQSSNFDRFAWARKATAPGVFYTKFKVSVWVFFLIGRRSRILNTHWAPAVKSSVNRHAKNTHQMPFLAVILHSRRLTPTFLQLS